MPPEQAQAASTARDVQPAKSAETERQAAPATASLRDQVLTPPATASERQVALAEVNTRSVVAPAVLRTDGLTPDFEIVDMSATTAAQSRPEAPNPVIDQKARALKDALDYKAGIFGVGIIASPQVDDILRILDPLSPEERLAVEKRYQDLFDPSHPYDAANPADGKLRVDLATKFGADSPPFRQIEALLERQLGTTNDAGQAMEALAKIKQDRLSGEAELRGVFSTLNSQDSQRLQKEFQEKYGKTLEQAMQDANVSPETTAFVDSFRAGAENRSADDLVRLANLAMNGSVNARAELAARMQGSGLSPDAVQLDLSKPYKEILKDVLAGSSPAAVEARRQLQADPEFEKKFAQAFSDYKGNPDSVLRDYVTSGGTSLSTIVEKNMGKPLGFMLDNPASVTLATENASAAERENYRNGRSLAGRDNDPALTAPEKAALDYYNRTHDSLTRGAGDKPWLADSWEANLLYGKDNAISQMAKNQRAGVLDAIGVGRWHSADDILSTAENLGEKDWQRLNAEFKANPAQGGQFRADIAASLDSYAPAEKERILNLLDAKAKTETFAQSQSVKRGFVDLVGDNTTNGLLGQTTQSPANIVEGILNLSAQELNRYKTDSSFQTQVDALVFKSLSGPDQLLATRLLEKARALPEGQKLQADPIDQVLLDRLKGAPIDEMLQHIQAAYQTKDASGQTLSERLQAGKSLSAEDRLISSVIDAQGGPLLRDNTLPSVQKFRRNDSMPDVYAAGAKAPESEQQVLRALMTPEQRQLLDAAIKQKDDPNGPLRLEDKLRSFVLGDNTQPEQFKEQLAKLTEAEKVDLKKAYATKYGSEAKPDDLDKDVLGKLEKSQQVEFTNLLSTGERDSRQSFYDNLRNYIDRSGVTVDGTENNIDRALRQQQDALEQYQRVYQTLPKEKQQLLDEYFNKSFEQYKDSKDKLSDMAIDAAITATALAAAPFSAGMSLTTIAAMSAGGAAFRLAAKEAMVGSDFDTSAANVTKELINGGAATALNFVGAREIDGLMTSAQKAGGVFGNYLAKHGVSEATARAAGVAAGINMEALAGGAVGAGMNVGSELLLAPVNGQSIDWNTLWQSAETGFALGAVIPVGIKGLQGIGHGVDGVMNVVRGKRALEWQPELNRGRALIDGDGHVVPVADGASVELSSANNLAQVDTAVVGGRLVDKRTGEPLKTKEGLELDEQGRAIPASTDATNAPPAAPVEQASKPRELFDPSHRSIDEVPVQARAEAAEARKLYSRQAAENPNAPLVDAKDLFEQWKAKNPELGQRASTEVAARDAYDRARGSGDQAQVDRAKTAYADAVKATDEIIKPRGAEVEKRINDALAAEGLPPIKVDIAGALDGDAAFSFDSDGNPRIAISRRALLSDEGKLQELINHEADHYLQVALEGRRVRELAESGGAALDPNKPADLERFRQAYAEHMQKNEGDGPRGGMPSDEYLRSLIKTAPLTEPQRKLADRLLAAAQSGAPVRADSIETANLFGEIGNKARPLTEQIKANEQAGAFNHDIIDDILDPSKKLLTRREWDQNPDFTEAKIEAIRQTINSTMASAAEKNASARQLLDILDKRQSDINAWREKAQEKYSNLDQIDELYADVAGATGRATAGYGRFAPQVADERVYDVGDMQHVDGWSRSADSGNRRPIEAGDVVQGQNGALGLVKGLDSSGRTVVYWRENFNPPAGPSVKGPNWQIENVQLYEPGQQTLSRAVLYRDDYTGRYYYADVRDSNGNFREAPYQAFSPGSPLFRPGEPSANPRVQPPDVVRIGSTPLEPNKMYVVGRSGSGNDIGVPDAPLNVSRRQVAVYVDEQGNKYVADMGAVNGTFVNGQRLGTLSSPGTFDPRDPAWHKLEPNESVQLGRTQSGEPVLLDLKVDSNENFAAQMASTKVREQWQDFKRRQQSLSAVPDASFDIQWQIGSKGNMGHDIRAASYVDAAGDTHKVVIHVLGPRDQPSRLINELVASDLSGTLWGDYPATTSRKMVIDGVERDVWIQEGEGAPLENKGGGFLRNKAWELYGSSVSDNVLKVIESNPDIKEMWERQAVERAIFGDIDDHPGNKIYYQRPDGSYAIRNIDLDFGFPLGPVPVWQSTVMKGADRRLYAALSQTPLSQQTVERVNEFIKIWDTPEGRSRMINQGLTQEQSNDVINRAKWLAEHGTFPEDVSLRPKTSE